MPRDVDPGLDSRAREAFDLMVLIADGEKKAGAAGRNRSDWLERFEQCRQIVADSRGERAAVPGSGAAEL